MICVFLQHDRKLKGGLQGGEQERLFVFVAVFFDNFFAEVIKPIFFVRLHFFQCCSLSVYERQFRVDQTPLIRLKDEKRVRWGAAVFDGRSLTLLRGHHHHHHHHHHHRHHR